jgi:threonine synthase
MLCLSTRGGASVGLSEAIDRGLAPDGGLYVPEVVPRIEVRARELAEVAAEVLAPYFAAEPLESELGDICAATYGFDAPVTPLGGDDQLLELFHGPTAAFKDYGARFLAEYLARQSGDERTVLVATSGDTGAAVAAAFHRRPGFRVVILYPDGRVSPRQAHQLGAFGDNVRAFRVHGSFDDCQRLAKQAFADEALTWRHGLTSANSINLGRLLPQVSYYAAAALRSTVPVSFVVPSGNLGNALACLISRAMGLPIDRVVLATNANTTLVELVRDGRWAPRDSVATLANAMDVGAPSNAERLQVMFPLLERIEADSVGDEDIKEAIRRTYVETGVVLDPHTACGVEVLHRLRARGVQGKWIVAATAHAAKFSSVVEPIIGAAVTPPRALAELLERHAHADPLSPTLDALRIALA